MTDTIRVRMPGPYVRRTDQERIESYWNDATSIAPALWPRPQPRRKSMFAFFHSLRTLPQRFTDQQSAIEKLRKRCDALEAENAKLRAACIEPRLWGLGSILFSAYDTKPYTAMDAVRLLLDHQGLTISHQAKNERFTLEKVKAPKKARRR